MQTQGNAVAVSIVVNTVMAHTQIHADEIAATNWLREHGETHFPGIGKATLKFTVNLTPMDDASFDRLGILPIGCGSGNGHRPRFDEHDNDQPEGRIPGECAATLMIKYLGIEDPIIRRMANAILICDTQRGVKTTELPELIKAFHRRLPDGNAAVVTWATKALKAIELQLRLNVAKVTGEHTLLEWFASYEKAGHFPDAKACASLKKMLIASTEAKDNAFFELAHIIECLSRTGIIPTEEVVEWVRFPLAHIYADQVEFWKSIEECKGPKARWFDVRTLCGGRDERLPLLFIRSDNPLVARAAKHRDAGGAAIVAVRNSRGQVQIFIDANIKGLNLVNCARMLRWLELLKDAKGVPYDNIPWDELGAGGQIEQVPIWYFFRQASQLLNGSLTHPDVKATLIGDSAIIDVLRRAFHPALTNAWMQERGIERPNGHRSAPELETALEKAVASRTSEPVSAK